MLKSQQSDDCKNEYASQLQQTNQHQHEHYHTHMPQVFQVIQNVFKVLQVIQNILMCFW